MKIIITVDLGDSTLDASDETAELVADSIMDAYGDFRRLHPIDAYYVHDYTARLA